jgi:hypothetical protein
MTYQKFPVIVISSELIGCEEVAGTFVWRIDRHDIHRVYIFLLDLLIESTNVF